MRTIYKFTLIVWAYTFGIAHWCFGQHVVKHIIDRGETIATIAQKYGTSEAAILELNPEASHFTYVGMELTVPSTDIPVEPLAVTATGENVVSTAEEESTLPIATPKKSGTSGTCYVGIFGGYSLNNYVGDDADYDSRGGFHLGVLTGYQFNSNLFAEVGLGLATKGYKQTDQYETGYWSDDELNFERETHTKMQTFNLEIPIYVGATCSHVFLKAGPYASYALSGEMKKSTVLTTHEDIHSSEISDTSDKTKIADIDHYNRFRWGLGGSVGFHIGHVTISGTYQRGLTQIVRHSKEYEQNLLFTLGIVL